MTITSISQAKRDKNRVNIFIDGEFRFGVDINTMSEYMLFQGKVLSQEELDTISSRDAVNYLYRRIKDWWYRRPRGSREVRTKLLELRSKHKDGLDDEEVIALVFTKLTDSGYSDDAFAEWYILERVRQGKYGRHKLRNELVSKGVTREIISDKLDSLFTDEQAAGIKVLQKKYGVSKLTELTDFKIRERAYKFLSSRGFSATDYN